MFQYLFCKRTNIDKFYYHQGKYFYLFIKTKNNSRGLQQFDFSRIIHYHSQYGKQTETTHQQRIAFHLYQYVNE